MGDGRARKEKKREDGTSCRVCYGFQSFPARYNGCRHWDSVIDEG